MCVLGVKGIGHVCECLFGVHVHVSTEADGVNDSPVVLPTSACQE